MTPMPLSTRTPPRSTTRSTTTATGRVDEGFSTTSAPGIRPAISGVAGGVVDATARWSAPASTGGLPVTGYRVQAQKLDADGTIVSRVTRSAPRSVRALVVQLDAGRYKFRVAAVNAAGRSAWSVGSAGVRAR